MSRSYTVGEIATKIRQRGNYEEQDGDYSDSFITDTLLYDFIDSANCELYDRLIEADSDATPVVEYSFAPSAATSSLPSDFYKMKAVDVDAGSGLWAKVPGYSSQDRDMYQVPDGSTAGTVVGALLGTGYAYRVEGKLGGEMQLRVVPTPGGSDTFRLTYVPVPSKLTGSAQTVDGVNGFEELLVLYALRRCQAREGVSVGNTDAEIQRQERRVSRAASSRDIGQPLALTDPYTGRRWPGR